MTTLISGKQRLIRDLIELQRENLTTISAEPLDNDIYTWHVNISPNEGYYKELYFHLEMQFAKNYPSMPPSVKILTPISHPNIFDSFLCLSMLRPHTSTTPYEGWSSAYTATSILMQLQSFIFAENIEQDNGQIKQAWISNSELSYSKDKLLTFICKTCGHCHDNPNPKIKDKNYINDGMIKEMKKFNIDIINKQGMIDEIWINIFTCLQYQNIYSLKFVNSHFNNIITKYNLMERNEIYCFYSKLNLINNLNSGLILGIGLNVVNSGLHNKLNIETSYDIISKTAFDNGCNIGVWGENLTHFIPLIINKKHIKYSESILYESLNKLNYQ